MKLKLFYSWQSDIPFNNQAIRDALKLAIIDLEKEQDNPRIDLIDSTSNQIGATRIPDLILRDISSCDIFVCDLTIIGSSVQSGRNIPNPNVLLELGYALSKLGWNRTIVIFNEACGDLVRDLPFDIEKRSVIAVRIQSKDDANGKGLLKAKLREWIQRIITQNPAKAVEASVSADSVKRSNDVKNLKAILKIFEIDEMDDFFSHGHVEITRSFTRKWEDLEEMMRSKEFHMYDLVAGRILQSFRETGLVMKELLAEYKSGTVYYKHNEVNGFNQKRFDAAKSRIKRVEQAYTEVLNHIRASYLEIKVRKKKY